MTLFTTAKPHYWQSMCSELFATCARSKKTDFSSRALYGQSPQRKKSIRFVQRLACADFSRHVGGEYVYDLIFDA